MKNYISKSHESITSFKNATGPIRFNLTNDFMFHVVFEENKPALCQLVGSLLHMSQDEIFTLTVKNPVDYGTFPNDKRVILDLKLLLNNTKIVNIEMQVLDDGDWADRSVLYLCRCYDSVLRGQDYDTIMPAHQISILDFDPSQTIPEFYATHHLRNDKTGAVYTGNFVLSVLNLKQLELATDEDKKWQIDHWARLFKATTWEELRMTATDSFEMTNVAETLYDKNQDEYARSWAMSREMFLFDERRRKAKEKKALEELAKIKKELEEFKAETENARAEAENARSEVEQLRAKLISHGIDPDV